MATAIERLSKAIHEFLVAETSLSEKIIRDHFGHNPDTGKALRMLLKNNSVRRFGRGGRSDPFVYMALTQPPLNELERLQVANATGD